MPELHNIYRPRSIEEFAGNASLKAILKEKIENDDLPQCIMFTGERGCGKSTLSRLLPKLCGAAYVHEVNIGISTGVDDMRNLLHKMRLSPLLAKGESKKRFYILNEFQMASVHAQNSLLDDSENPPENVYFIICTTNPEKVIKTIRSRFTQFELQPLSSLELMNLLGWVCREEGKEHISLKVLRKISQVSEGIPREALITLNKVLNIEDEEEALAAIENSETESDVKSICLALGELKNSNPWPNVRDRLKNFNGDPEATRRAILGWFTSVLLNSKSSEVMANRAEIILTYFVDSFFESGKAGLVMASRLACRGIAGDME